MSPLRHGAVIILAGALAAHAARAQAKSTAEGARAAGQRGTSARGSVVAQAHADILGQAGQGITGSVDLTERKDGTFTFVEIHLTAKGLKPGLHGVHLHAVGKCEPDFTAAGGHFDPGPAGNTDPDANHPYHMGDIPQLEVGANGEGTLNAITTRVTLSPGPLTLFDADGTAVIIHANPDQGITGEPKSGVSGGPRVACGVIQKK
jgi:superoxide dismutase, Cu-Zn family